MPILLEKVIDKKGFQSYISRFPKISNKTNFPKPPPPTTLPVVCGSGWPPTLAGSCPAAPPPAEARAPPPTAPGEYPGSCAGVVGVAVVRVTMSMRLRG